MPLFSEIVERTLALLERRGRVSYTALRLEFGADDATLAALRDELVDVLGVADDEDGRVLARRAPAAPLPASAAAPERRQLTVLLCDLVASTPLAEALDPEDLSALMGRYHALCNAVVARFDGHVSQWIGDGVAVYFGFPRTHEDDAERAVRCGWEIVQAIRAESAELERRHGAPLAVRVGIDTGTTVVGGTAADSRGGTLAFGETPNVAARVQAHSAPDTVTVSARTHALVGGRFAFEPLGAHPLRGIARPVELFRVLAPLEGRARFEARATRGVTPLVGRAPERTALRAACTRAAGGTRTAVLLRGEPGIGKSRLLAAARSTAELELGMERIALEASPYHQGTALHPVVEGLRRHWRLDEPGGEERLRAAAPDPRAVALLAGALHVPRPAGVPALETMSPQRERHETLGALAATLAAAARRRPLLLAVEDLHWVDPTTLALLDVVLGGAPDTPLLLLMTARPEFESPWGDRMQTLELARMDRADTLALVTAAGARAGLGDEVARRIAERAGGVPLFAEELTRAVAGRSADVEIPTSLYGSLMAQLDRDPVARSVAQLAATAGRRFELDLLGALDLIDPGALRAGLDRLVRDQLVQPTGDDSYEFHHALIQDAARGSLLRETRQRYNRRIAEVLLSRFPELAARHPERVARHFEYAGALREAAGHWLQAGLAALQRSANQEASTHFERALGLTAQLPEDPARAGLELSLHVLAALPLVATRGWTAPEVVAHYDRAEALGREVESAPQLFQAMQGILTYRMVSGQLAEAAELGAELVGIAEATGDPELILEAECEAGNALVYLGRFDEALPRLERVGRLYDPPRHHHHAALYGKDPAAIALVHVALAAACRGDLDAAQTAVEEAIVLVQDWPHPFSHAWVHVCRAVIHLLRDEVDDARAAAETGVTTSIAEGFPNWEAQGSVYLGWARVAQGEYAPGLEALRRGIAMWTGSGAELMRPFMLGLLGDALLRAGEPDEGLAAVDEALAAVARTGERWCEPELQRLRAELLAAAGDAHAAAAAASGALALARRRGAAGWERRAAATLARVGNGSGVA